MTRALSLDALGAWLVKASGAVPSTRTHVRTGFAGVDSWCVRATYRTGLIAAGQPVLLWVSGHEAQHPAGIYALGRTTGGAADGTMPIELTALSHPLLRSQLVGHPALAGMEVLRMPAGSNPSYVTQAQLRVLGELDPEIARLA